MFLIELRDYLENKKIKKPSLKKINQSRKISIKNKKKQKTKYKETPSEDLQFKVAILEEKVEKMGQIIAIKDEKIRFLEEKLSEYQSLSHD